MTEVGLIPATSVKAVIGEFKKYNYVDAIEVPRKEWSLCIIDGIYHIIIIL